MTWDGVNIWLAHLVDKHNALGFSSFSIKKWIISLMMQSLITFQKWLTYIEVTCCHAITLEGSSIHIYSIYFKSSQISSVQCMTGNEKTKHFGYFMSALKSMSGDLYQFVNNTYYNKNR